MRPSLTFWIRWVGLVVFGTLVYQCIIPKIVGGERARPTAAMADINGGIKSALVQFKNDTGSYPKTLAELLQNTEGRTNWQGPYAGKMWVDPWGNEYKYVFPGTHDTNAYDLFSAGPDGRVGTKDDIGNWQ